ncbi:MAG: tetratricopeptide repeat protein [Thermodesulfobacteriota bacterium]
MATEKVKRKLTAILSADVKGYSRLMGVDEVGTIRTLETYRKVMSDLIQKKGGRVVDSPGDNVLAEFASVVDALESAVEIQRELKVRNADLSESRRMEFRMGINLGDVVEEGSRIYGDGVNIAARIEGLAEGGGICISRMAFDNVKNKLNLGYEYLGEHSVKNIAEPVRVYKVLIEPEAVGKVIGEAGPKRAVRWYAATVAAVGIVVTASALTFWYFHLRRPAIAPARVDKMAFPLPDKPSIAVLPFVNMSDDPKQELFCDGLTDTIITNLSRLPQLFLIARNSTFTYKGKPVKVQQVAQDLGVRYVMEGSVQKSEKRIRVRAQLIDAINGRHLWAESYDRSMEDIFALQDEITRKVITSLQVELTMGEYAHAIGKGTQSLEALELYWRANYHLLRGTKEDNRLSRKYAEKAIEIDPGFSAAWAELGFTHNSDSMQGWSSSREQSLKSAEGCAQKALSLNRSELKALMLLCWISLNRREHDKAIEYAEKALEVSPNDPRAYTSLGTAMRAWGRFEEAIANARKAMRLTPYYPVNTLLVFAYSSYHLRRYDDALSAGERLLERCRKGEFPEWHAHLLMVAIHSELGQEERARKYATELLNASPNWNLETWKRSQFYKNQSDLDRLVNAARKAGLPDKPPLPLPDKPSIAVLPFVNMSDDKSQEYFSDGLTEEIITALSKTPKLFIIARNSSFVYKGKPVNVQQVSRELGVKYVLEGSVRRSGDQLRITAQLIDAATGNHLWAERYDWGMKNMFALQDEITLRVIAALQVKLTEGEQALMFSKGTDDFEAYERFLRGREYVLRFDKEGNIIARKLAEDAIALDPRYPGGYRLLATTHMMDVWYGLAGEPKISLMKAAELYQKVCTLDPSDAVARSLLGLIYTMMRQHDKGIAEGEKAVALNPNAADAHAYFGNILHLSGRNKEAIEEIKKAIRLNPFPPNIYFMYLGHACLHAGMYEDSISAYEKALRLQPDNLFVHLRLAAVYSILGREDLAHAKAAEVLRMNSRFSVDQFAKTVPFKNQADTEYLIGALRKAGLK